MLHTPAAFARYRGPMHLRAALLALTLAAAAPSALAQQQQQQQPAQPRGESWYRTQLVELAEVLGGAHYLRILCDGRGDQRWRDYMRGVIEREPRYNTDLVDSFNRGYRQEEARFYSCDNAARQVEAELRARGLRVSQALSARHQ
ncbi:MAG: TIGR02301 family protein [Hyphomonadaceae bacterium]|nr:TIGR02301 family protein [Hyphomonadaceae bacterium]MBX3510491.1 TIGR02301 family protein [Hyphomonadaceae bacterium]